MKGGATMSSGPRPRRPSVDSERWSPQVCLPSTQKTRVAVVTAACSCRACKPRASTRRKVVLMVRAFAKACQERDRRFGGQGAGRAAGRPSPGSGGSSRARSACGKAPDSAPGWCRRRKGNRSSRVGNRPTAWRAGRRAPCAGYCTSASARARSRRGLRQGPCYGQSCAPGSGEC